MPTKVYDLKVITGSYTGRDGKQHNNYETIGSVFKRDKDNSSYIMLKATFNPAGVPRKDGSSSIVVWLNTPKDDKQQQGNNETFFKSNTPPEDWEPDDDNLPF